MAGYDDTYKMIINCLMGRPNGTEIQPEKHQEYALNMLNYIRSLELVANAPLIGVADENTQPIQPDNSRACYIAGVGQNRTVTFHNFYDYEGNPISITSGDMEGFLAIFIWNGQNWSATSVPTNIISQAENATFYYRYNIRKTYSSLADMNADASNPIGTDGTKIKIGDLVSVVNPSNGDENGIYSYEGAENGWQFQGGINVAIKQETGQSANDVMSQKAVTDELSKLRTDFQSNLTTAINNEVTARNKAISDAVLAAEIEIRKDMNSADTQLNNAIAQLQERIQTAEGDIEDNEEDILLAQMKIDLIEKIAIEAIQGATARFDDIIEDANILSASIGSISQIVFVKNQNKFAGESNGTYYNNWSSTPSADLYMNSDRTSALKDKIYLLDKNLYVFDKNDNFVSVGENWDKAIAILISKTDAILPCVGQLESGETTTVDGLYLQEDAKGKIKSLTLVKNGMASTVTPEIGKFYLYSNLYYGYTGKELLPIGSGSGSGSGSGFFNVTKEVPLSEGFYTLSTAVEALRNADIDDEQKSGMIITFETASGEWVDYRFVGTDISMFYDISAWEEYGGKGTVKQITVSRGALTNILTPDKSGNVNLDIPVVEVDETIDDNSTNPVQNKAVAAEFKGLAGKYGAALRLNTIGEGDEKAYSLSLLTEGGEELSTTETFTGGGGGSIVTTKITLTRLTPNPTVKNGDTVELSYKYDQIDTTTGESTGNSAKSTVTIVRGATSSSFESTIPAGSTQKIDVTKYLGIGTNNVRVRVEVGDGEEKQVSSISWTVSVIQLTLTSSFNIATIIDKGDKISVPYALTGSGTKTLRCYIDGVDVEDRSITTSTANGSFQIDTSAMAHGAHSVQMVAELELSDESIIKSNSIYFDIAVRETGNTAPIIATRFDYQDGTIISGGNRPYIPVKQYDNYVLTYAAYNPQETPTTVEVYEAGTLVSSAKVSFITTKLNVRAMNYGTSACKFVCGMTEYHFNLNVTKSDLNLVEPTDGMQLKLSAQGRSNNDTNREEWTYGDITTEFSGFNWGGDGWVGNALRHTSNARSVVKYKPLEQPTQSANNAFAFLIKYKVSEVVDDNAAIISCVDDNGTGFVITPTEARMVTRGNSLLAMKMASDNVYEVGFVSFPVAADGSSDYEKENTEMVYLYINGIMSGSVQRGTSDSIYQSTPSYINMGADGATLDVYLMRGYNTFLTDDQMLSCYILDQETADELIDEYNSNDILDDNGNVSVENIPDGMRVVIITGRQTNGVATVLQAAVNNNKDTKYDVDQILSYVKNGDPKQNFLCIGGCIRLQGTSSLAYPIKNYRIYFKNAAKEEGKLYLGCNEQGIGGELQEKAKFSFRLASSNNYAAAPVDCFCTKADFAESSSSHNTGMARIVQDTLLGIGEFVPPQKYVNREQYQYDVRTTIDGEPCLFFYRGTVEETPQFLGKFNWNNDKSTEDVFGFLNIPGYHDQAWVTEKFEGNNPTECWEFLNNDYPMGMFLDDDFDTKGEDGIPNWLKVFEARFPDDDNINAEYEAGTKKPKYLEALVKWVKSTDTTAEGLDEEEKKARAKKFRDELGNYFDVNYLCDYYEFTDIFACVDQRVKNMMMAFWYSPDMDRMLAYMIFYDNDTILGVRNDGRLKYNWDIDENTIDTELTTPDKTVYAFAGHDSVLWKNLREQFPDELKAAYIRIRAKLTNDNIFQIFDKEQSEKFCERIYNLDAINKYVVPKTIGIEVNNDGVVSNVKYSYLEAMQGSRMAHRHWFVTNRMGLFDAWGSTGQYTATDISFKGNSAAGATVKAVAAREFYFEFRREGETMTHDKVTKDELWSYTYNQVANIGTIFHLFGGVWMKKLDLSDWGGFTDMNIPILPILEELVLGNSNKTYTLTELVIGTKLPMLESLEIVNYTNLPSLDLSGCTRIKAVNATGCNALSTILFAQGAPLSTLHLPKNYQTLTLRSLPEIKRTGITFDNLRSITGLWVENCSQLDGFALFNEMFALSEHTIKYVRLTNLNLEGDGSDLEAWYDAGLGGIDAQGNIVNNKCKICGYYQLTSYLDDETFAAYVERFDELNIRQPQYTMISCDDTVSDDMNYSNLDNKTGYEYDNEYQPSGHITKILSKRYGCLGKQAVKGVMTICKLNDKDFNYYADGATTTVSTPAKLDSTEGDAFMYEPDYWYKGINDVLGAFSEGVSKKYSCFSSNEDMPDKPAVDILTLEDIKAASNYQKGYKILTGKTTVADATSQDNNYSICKVDISGYKYVRFPSVLGTSLVGAIVTDANSAIIQNILIETLDAKFVNGMYVIIAVPENAQTLQFSIHNNAEFDCVVLSNSDKVEDMEPDWVKHKACLTGMFEAINIGSKLYSAANGVAGINNLTQPDFSNYAQARNLQLVDWEMHKDVANLFYAKYGRRDAQDQCGYGQNTTSRIVGSSAFLGMTDTINPDHATEYAWYEDENRDLVRIPCTRCLGYENWWGNLAEWMDKVGLPNTPAADTYKYTITMPDGTIRKVLSSTSSGNYVKSVYHQKFMDVINVSNSNGSSTTFYTDVQWISNATNRVVYRSSYSAYANGGVSYAYAHGDSSGAYTSIGCRLAFRGAIVIAESVAAFKALPTEVEETA